MQLNMLVVRRFVLSYSLLSRDVVVTGFSHCTMPCPSCKWQTYICIFTHIHNCTYIYIYIFIFIYICRINSLGSNIRVLWQLPIRIHMCFSTHNDNDMYGYVEIHVSACNHTCKCTCQYTLNSALARRVVDVRAFQIVNIGKCASESVWSYCLATVLHSKMDVRIRPRCHYDRIRCKFTVATCAWLLAPCNTLSVDNVI